MIVENYSPTSSEAKPKLTSEQQVQLTRAKALAEEIAVLAPIALQKINDDARVAKEIIGAAQTAQASHPAQPEASA